MTYLQVVTRIMAPQLRRQDFLCIFVSLAYFHETFIASKQFFELLFHHYCIAAYIRLAISAICIYSTIINCFKEYMSQTTCQELFKFKR